MMTAVRSRAVIAVDPPPQFPLPSPTDINGDTAYVAGARGEALHADGELGLPEAAADGGFRMLLKTNMLYDAAAVPNIGIEAAFGNDWSVGVNWMHAWWSRNLTHRYWRAGEITNPYRKVKIKISA